MSGRMETRCDTCASYEYCDEIYECDDCRTEALQHAERQASVIARQARTIRRLRALADGYRIRRRVLLDTYGAMAQHLKDCIEYANRDVCKKERARIVAALRENGGLGDMPNFTLRLDYACNVIADAIERGEL